MFSAVKKQNKFCKGVNGQGLVILLVKVRFILKTTECNKLKL